MGRSSPRRVGVGGELAPTQTQIHGHIDTKIHRYTGTQTRIQTHAQIQTTDMYTDTHVDTHRYTQT